MGFRVPGALAGALLAALSLSCTGVHAADTRARIDDRGADFLRDRIFFVAGADHARDSAFAWAGLVAAPLGRLGEDGPRIRVMGGAGRYRYRTADVPGGANAGRVTSGEILAGYRSTFGPVLVSLYLGAHVEDQRLAAPDPGHPAVGTELGVKAALELFAQDASPWSASGFASVSTVHRAYRLRAALAHEFPSGLSLGVEGAVHGDARYNEPRVGAFLHTNFHGNVITLAGGVLSNSDKGDGLYATLSLYAPY